MGIERDLNLLQPYAIKPKRARHANENVAGNVPRVSFAATGSRVPNGP